jgi:uncharacterized alpha/beta hydrolase family protein
MHATNNCFRQEVEYTGSASQKKRRIPMGTIKVEVNGDTAEEVKKQLQQVMDELDKVKLAPGAQPTGLGKGKAWKVSYET